MASVAPVVETTFSDLKLVRRGKVRDVYEVDEERLLIVATDRISAFDCVLPTPVERKGEVLTALSSSASSAAIFRAPAGKTISAQGRSAVIVCRQE